MHLTFLFHYHPLLLFFAVIICHELVVIKRSIFTFGCWLDNIVVVCTLFFHACYLILLRSPLGYLIVVIFSSVAAFIIIGY